MLTLLKAQVLYNYKFINLGAACSNSTKTQPLYSECIYVKREIVKAPTYICTEEQNVIK